MRLEIIIIVGIRYLHAIQELVETFGAFSNAYDWRTRMR
jgi:hypothetical protein